MPILQIEGVGEVEIDQGFTRLTPEQQNATVEEIVTQIRGGQGGPATPAAAVTAAEPRTTAPDPNVQGMREELPTDVVERGSILPVGVTREGKATLALPEFLEGPRRTIMDLLEGKRAAKDISGKEIFELGALFGGGSSAAGTGPGIARAAQVMTDASRPGIPASAAASAAERSAAPIAETAARAAPEIPAVAPAPIAPQSAVAPAAATAAPAAPAARGGLHSTAETLAMRGEAKAQFKPLDEAGVVVSPQSFGAMTQRVFSEAAGKALDETLTPASMAVVKRMQAASTEPITLQSLNVLREVANVAAGSKIPRDREIADNIIGALDDFVMGLKSKDLMLGTEVEAAAVAKSLVGARKTWSEMSKLETVARLVQRAQDSVANRPSLGIENSLRTEFTNLSKNDRAMRTFTTAERKAIRAVTRGATKTIARSVGRIAPTGPLSLGAFGGVTTMIGAKLGLDPLSSAVAIGPPLAGITFGGRKLAAVLTQRSIKNLEKVIKSSGDSNPLAGSATERSQALTERIAAALNTGMQAQAIEPQPAQ